ncbi:hypothetical protein ANTQUA_LOCUS3287 [Anthophora quadrimaculata]
MFAKNFLKHISEKFANERAAQTRTVYHRHQYYVFLSSSFAKSAFFSSAIRKSNSTTGKKERGRFLVPSSSRKAQTTLRDIRKIESPVEFAGKDLERFSGCKLVNELLSLISFLSSYSFFFH